MSYKKILYNNGVQYELGGGMGSWAKSFENGVKHGDVRRINLVLMYAYTVRHKYAIFLFKKSEVNWCPVDETFNTPENLRNWMNRQ